MASYTNGNKFFGIFSLLAFIALSSSQTTTATSHRLRSLYLRMLVSCNQLQVSRDELSSAITQTRDVSGVIHHSSVDSISGLDAHLGDVSVFDQEEIGNIPDLLINHLTYLKLTEGALRLYQQDELVLKIVDDSLTTYEHQLETIIKNVVNIRKTINITIQIFGRTFDSGSVQEVTFDACDITTTTCITRRGLYILQEFDYYLRIARRNFVTLSSS
ncbi:uncharacterized protein [Apostichopus japonicus]|uniref:uncharacterized protein n=1 Tax=Stichopus japonicus TaxID=307972 RepID=UPI003AB62901